MRSTALTDEGVPQGHEARALTRTSSSQAIAARGGASPARKVDGSFSRGTVTRDGFSPSPMPRNRVAATGGGTAASADAPATPVSPLTDTRRRRRTHGWALRGTRSTGWTGPRDDVMPPPPSPLAARSPPHAEPPARVSRTLPLRPAFAELPGLQPPQRLVPHRSQLHGATRGCTSAGCGSRSCCQGYSQRLQRRMRTTGCRVHLHHAGYTRQAVAPVLPASQPHPTPPATRRTSSCRHRRASISRCQRDRHEPAPRRLWPNTVVWPPQAHS